MKTPLFFVAIFLFFTITQACAYSVSDFSSDTKIISALRVLEQSGDYDVFRNLQRNGVRIKFSNLSNVPCNPAKCFAVSTFNEFGTRVILINSAYKDAPSEQIACLIAHESYHKANVATLQEETLATEKEAACWSRLKVVSKTYPDSKLTRRLDKLSGLYLASNNGNNLVQQKIANSGFYRSQLGF